MPGQFEVPKMRMKSEDLLWIQRIRSPHFFNQTRMCEFREFDFSTASVEMVWHAVKVFSIDFVPFEGWDPSVTVSLDPAVNWN